MIKDDAIPNGIVKRRMAPSSLTALHMGVASAILKGDEMDPRDAPTAKPAASQVAETPRRPAAWIWSFPKSIREATPYPVRNVPTHPRKGTKTG